jgi:beta-glucosidase
MKERALFPLLLGFIGVLVAGQTYPFQDTTLSFEARVDDLVSRLTLLEMQNQMARGGVGEYGGPAPGIPRLGIGPYQWTSECVSGAARAQENATAFPEPIGLSATFSPRLMHVVADAIGREVRGKHNDFVKRGIFAGHTGASCFSPVINIVRDPRWGRIEETYGEDPFLSGVLSQMYVTGLQGNHSRFVQATAGCKHFDVHGGPESERSHFDAQVSDSDWRMTFLPAFRKCVQAGTFSLMCSYNRLNGIPACAHKQLLTDILRKEWNFTGYVISDQQAIENIINDHHYTDNYVDTAAAAVNAGCNIELGNDIAQNVYSTIVEAVKQGKLTEDVVRERVKPLFYTRMRLGQFDPPANNPYAQLNNSVVETPEHIALALEAAMKSFVLLKNQNNTLPLKKEAYSTVGIVGPFADNYEQLFSDYHANQDRSYTKTPLQALKELFPNSKYGKACADKTPCQQYDQNIVQNTVTGADLIFVVLGTGIAVEREGIDRPNLELPGHQKQLLEDVIKFNNDAKIILLLFNAGPLNVSFADDSNRVNAILECFYPGQSTGVALINVLTNKDGNSSPAGRLSVTWPRYETQLRAIGNYSMEGRTYRYIKTDPLYPFGYGLSYSVFRYAQLTIIGLTSPTENLNVSLNLINVGSAESDEVVQCYIEWGNKSLPVPQRQLVHFSRLHLKPGQSTTHAFQIRWDNWAFREYGGWTIQAGSMTLYCGGQQPGQLKSAPSNVISIDFDIPRSARLATL